MRPKVSVVMPVLNGERFIGEAIQSVVDQTYKHCELVVVDDGCTDGTTGIGVAPAPGSASGSASSSPSRYVDQFRPTTASTRGPVVPKPVRRNSRAVAIHCGDCVDIPDPPDADGRG